MSDEYLDVGQAKIFDMADKTPKRFLIGTINQVSQTSVEVCFPMDEQNGVRGLKTKFMRSQFSGHPYNGSAVQVRNGKLTMV